MNRLHQVLLALLLLLFQVASPLERKGNSVEHLSRDEKYISQILTEINVKQKRRRTKEGKEGKEVKGAKTVKHKQETKDKNHKKNSKDKKDKSSKKYDVVIGGAGAAGIAAALTFQNADITNFALVEGKDDIGGRIKAVEFGKKAGKNNRGYSIETGANYVSGGVLNPFYCEMKKLKDEMKGYNMDWTVRVNNLDGEMVLGDFDEDWLYDWDTYGEPENAAQRMVRAHEEAKWYSNRCLWREEGKGVNRWCHLLCDVNQTTLEDTGMGINDLVVTNKNICQDGVFVPKTEADMSKTDLMRVSNYFAQNDVDGTCVARVIEYIYNDIENGSAPWKTSAKHSFGDGGGTFEDFGAYRDFLIFDDRSYLFLLKVKASKALNAPKKTDHEIILKDDRLILSKKITKVFWDPDGINDVTVTYCDTEKLDEHIFPCANGDRYNITSENFVSTFSPGVLKKTLDLEGDEFPTFNTDDIAPRFYPPLSSVTPIKRGLDNIDMGSLIKVFFQFKCKFWDDKELFLTPYSRDGFDCDWAPAFFSLDGEKGYKGSNILALMTGGDRAEHLSKPENRKPSKIYEHFLPVFNTHFKDGIRQCLMHEGLNRTELTKDDIMELFLPDWLNDPLSRGCWMGPPNGMSTEDHLDFLASGPRVGNLIFSGEWSCRRHSGWVHGGWFSGERSAKVLMKERMEGFEDLDTRTLCDVKPEEMMFNDDECEWIPNVDEDIQIDI